MMLPLANVTLDDRRHAQSVVNRMHETLTRKDIARYFDTTEINISFVAGMTERRERKEGKYFAPSLLIEKICRMDDEMANKS